jgi:hypothetical protein
MIQPIVSEEEEKKVKVEVVDTVGIMFASREVMISAIFFEANTVKMKKIGFSWNYFSRGPDTTLADTINILTSDFTGLLM